MTMAANFNIAGFNIINTGTLTLPSSTDTLVGRATTDTLTNKTLTSPILTTPQINDASLTDQFIFAGTEIAADRTVTLPALTGNDTFVFEAHAQTLTNKTLVAGSNTISGLLHGTQVDNPSSGVHGVTGSVVGTSDTQTLTNKTMTDSTTFFQDEADNSKKIQFQLASISTTTTRTFTFPDITDTLVTLTATQTLTNKTLTAPVLTSPVLTTPEINDTSADHQYVFAVNELTADRTVTLPLLTGNDTFVFAAFAQTLTNKTLTTPIISQISNTGTLTLPATTDTLVGRATTDTLTNKTLGTGTVFSVIPTINDGITFTFNPSATVSGLNIGALAGDISTPANGDIWYNSTTNKFRARENGADIDLIGAGTALPVVDTTALVKGSADATKLLRFEVDGFTTSTTRVITPPNANIALVNTSDGLVRDTNIASLAAITLDKLATDPLARANHTGSQTASTISDLHGNIGTKKPVRIATTVAGTFTTSFENGDTIDGVVLATGDRILIKDQATASENGIYTVNASGAPTRATDYDTNAEVLGGQLISVEDGTENKNRIFILTNTGTITFGTTSLVFTEFNTLLRRSLAPRAPRPRQIVRQIQEDFASGHGFTLTAGAGTLSDDTTNFISGDRSIKLVTAGDNTDNDIDNAAISPTLDSRGKYFGMVLRVSDWANITEFRVFIGQDTSNNYNLSIHGDDTFFQINDEWVLWTKPLPLGAAVTGSPTRNEIDFIRFRIQDTGTAVTVNIDDIFFFDEPNEGTVVIMLDDSKPTHYTVAFPEMAKYGFLGTFFIIPETLGGSNLTLAQAQLLQKFGNHVACHSNTGITSFTTKEDKRNEFIRIKKFMTDNGFVDLDYFSWVGGTFDSDSMDVAKEFFNAIKLAGEAPETSPPADPMRYRVVPVGASTTESALETTVDNAMTEKTVAFLSFHSLVAASPTGTDWLISDFQIFMAFLNTKGYNVKTVKQYFEDLQDIQKTDHFVVRKTADQTVNNSITLVNDTQLSFIAQANKTYRLSIYLYFDSTTVADFQYLFVVPSGATIRRNNGNWSSTTSTTSQNIATANTVASLGNQQVLMINAILSMSTVGGRVNLQWAQATAEATNTNLKAGSIIEVVEC